MAVYIIHTLKLLNVLYIKTVNIAVILCIGQRLPSSSTESLTPQSKRRNPFGSHKGRHRSTKLKYD